MPLYLFATAVLSLMAVSGFFLLRRLIYRINRDAVHTRSDVDGPTAIWTGRSPSLIPGRFTVLPTAKILLAVFAAALLSRVCLIIWAWFLLFLSGETTGNLLTDFYTLWVHWDARHYYGIAKDGYTATGDARLRLVFFPLYPLFMRGFAMFTGGNLILAGTAVSVLSGACSAVLLYILAANLQEVPPADTVCAFLLNPYSVFLCCVYTEGLFLMLTLAAYVLRRFGHPWLYAFCGFLAALTRMPGVILAGIVIIDLIDQAAARNLTSRTVMEGILQIMIIFSGLLVYWGVNAAVTGDPWMYMTYQRENWFQQPGTVWNTAVNTLRYFMSSDGNPDKWWTWGTQAAVMLLVPALMAYAKALPFDLMAYSFVYTAVVLSPTWLLSGPRYFFGLFVLPLMQAYALRRSPVWVRTTCMLVSGMLLLLFVYGYTIAVEVL